MYILAKPLKSCLYFRIMILWYVCCHLSKFVKIGLPISDFIFESAQAKVRKAEIVIQSDVGMILSPHPSFLWICKLKMEVIVLRFCTFIELINVIFIYILAAVGSNRAWKNINSQLKKKCWAWTSKIGIGDRHIEIKTWNCPNTKCVSCAYWNINV